jgi:hypothetical protein
MAFIDIFNYKKYFKKSSDATVARVGHVNKLAEKVTPVEYVTQLISNTTPVEINAPVGQITMFGALSGSNSFRVDNNRVKTDSVVIASIEYSNIGDRADLVFTAPVNVVDGGFDIAWSTTTSTTGALKINFIVL